MCLRRNQVAYVPASNTDVLSPIPDVSADASWIVSLSGGIGTLRRPGGQQSIFMLTYALCTAWLYENTTLAHEPQTVSTGFYTIYCRLCNLGYSNITQSIVCNIDYANPGLCNSRPILLGETKQILSKSGKQAATRGNPGNGRLFCLGKSKQAHHAA